MQKNHMYFLILLISKVYDSTEHLYIKVVADTNQLEFGLFNSSHSGTVVFFYLEDFEDGEKV